MWSEIMNIDDLENMAKLLLSNTSALFSTDKKEAFRIEFESIMLNSSRILPDYERLPKIKNCPIVFLY